MRRRLESKGITMETPQEYEQRMGSMTFAQALNMATQAAHNVSNCVSLNDKQRAFAAGWAFDKVMKEYDKYRAKVLTS